MSSTGRKWKISFCRIIPSGPAAGRRRLSATDTSERASPGEATHAKLHSNNALPSDCTKLASDGFIHRNYVKSSVKFDLLSNFAGTGWSALMQLAFIPLYIKFMGIEAFGLIGFYLALQGMFQILDFGLSPTMNREMARYSAMPEKAGEARDFVRTFEVGYWTIGLVIGTTMLVVAPLIAANWIKANSLPIGVVQQAVMIMGVVSALQWPLGFYQSGLRGLQQQVKLNAIKIAMSTLSGGGAVLILWLISPTVTAFFFWQVFISAINVMLTTIILWRSLPSSSRQPRIDQTLIRNIWRFAAGMSGITLSSMILVQLDKIILSKLLSLEIFSYYILARVVGDGIAIIAAPVYNTIFPRFSALVVIGNQDKLKKLYHLSTQLMAVLILPTACVISLFSFDIMLLWTGNAETARMSSPIVSVLVIGAALNGLMSTVYALQLAHGWTSIGLFITTFFVVILAPAIFFMTTRYGAIGAASVWMTLNIIYMLIAVPLTHCRLLKGEALRWFAEDVGLPLLGAAIIVWAGREMIVSPMKSNLIAVANLSIVLLGALVAAALVAPQMRSWLVTKVSKGKVEPCLRD